jgi:HlyD family secretion protein
MRRRKFVLLLSLCVVGAALVSYAILSGGSQETQAYNVARIERGTILKSVSASGELNAVITVQVGSEISGQISELLADFNSEVHAGQVIARIAPESFEAKVQQAQAELAVAKATVATKSAAVVQARANLDNALSVLAAAGAEVERARVTAADLKLEYDRKNGLHQRGVIDVSSVDKARAAWQAARAQVNAAVAQLKAQQSAVAARRAQISMAEADVEYARAQVQQQEAAVHVAQINLENTFIRSPVDGVVIGRDVDIGQTVAASLQAPTLFTIAKDLRQMQVETAIDEADIGQIQPGQAATFTVDAFPGQEFRGTVTQVRKQPQEVQNVVTYTVIISADNPNLLLLPGMTANVQVNVSERSNVLKIPNAALRFTPPGAEPPPKQTGGAGPGSLSPQDRQARAQARLEQLSRQLDLSAEQQQQVAERTRSLLQRLQALRQSGEPAQDWRDTAAQLRQQLQQDIMGLLTPEQQQKFRLLIAERRSNPVTQARVWVPDAGKPKAVEVFIGVSDNAFTEMVRGDLQAGQAVITGVRRTARTDAGGSRRVGF